MFKFKLEHVLRYRSQLEDQAKMALGHALTAVATQQQLVDDTQAELQSLLSKSLNNGISNIDELWLHTNYVNRLKEDLVREQHKLGELELVAHKCRTDLMKKSQDRQLLDKLKEKKRERFHHDEAQKEQHDLDEMASIRHQAHVI